MQKINSLFANKLRLLKIYFLLLRGSYILGAVMALSMLIAAFHWFLVVPVLMGMAFLGLQFYGSLVAERSFKEAQHFGLYLALALNTLVLFSLFFPVALMGFYVLLNSEMRKNFPEDRNPQWLNTCFKYLEDFAGSKVSA